LKSTRYYPSMRNSLLDVKAY